MNQQVKTEFTSYQKMVMLVLALLQFVIVLDFMIIAPIGDLLIKTLDISTKQFGFVVSSYAFSAAISGIAIAGFADKFDRKKMLLVFFSGFIVGTLLCSLATSYMEILSARIITGIFAGVTGSTILTIIADIFPANMRGRVMGVVQMGFGFSQVIGIPLGLFIATRFDWHSTFISIVVVTVFIWFAIAFVFKPITEHLQYQSDKNAFAHLWHTLKNKDYQIGFMATTFLTIGGFILMPFSTIFLVNNVHIANEHLPIIFLTTGLSSLVVMPVVGKLSDKYDRFRIFMFAGIVASFMTIIYTHLTVTPLWIMVIFNMVFFATIMSRMSPAMALNSMVPKPEDRGAYMSISSSLQQTAGGLGSIVAGLIVYQASETSPLEHFDILGYVTVAVFIMCIYLVRQVDLSLKARPTPILGRAH
ncbi:MFS transporter [Cellvibrio sp.]|uniref:MFS transporter n=1 Tax=Cellvibrio sp. TaxID=1965322 RepID=UPI0039648ACE